MSSITKHPNLDKRSRESIAQIELEAQKAIDANDVAQMATQLSGVVSWQASIAKSIDDKDQFIVDEESAATRDQDFIDGLVGLGESFEAMNHAAGVIRKRLEDALQTVRAI